MKYSVIYFSTYGHTYVHMWEICSVCSQFACILIDSPADRLYEREIKKQFPITSHEGVMESLSQSFPCSLRTTIFQWVQ